MSLILVFVLGMAYLIKINQKSLKQWSYNFKEQSTLLHLWKDGKYMRVLSFSEGLLNNNPVNVLGLFFAGVSSYYLGVFDSDPLTQTSMNDQAIFYLRSYLEVNHHPRYEAEASYVLSKAYYKKGRAYAQLSLNYMQSAQNLGYHNLDMDEYIGFAYVLLGQTQQGIDYLLRSSHVVNNYSLYSSIVDAYIQNNELGKAITLATKIWNESTDDSLRDQALLKLAQLYYQTSNYDKSLQFYSDFLTKYPNNTDALFGLGEVYFVQKDLVKARQQWEIVRRLDPSNREVQARLSMN
jgi:tetratricopeptide (TPR) repeat protein